MASGVGATLREARLRREIELSEVEAALKIRLPYLRAIESEVWGALPGDAYARGFIRSYANYLGLDGDRLAAQYGGEPALTPVLPTAGRKPHRLSLIAAGAVFVVVAAIAIAGMAGGPGGGEHGSPSRPSGGDSHPSSAVPSVPQADEENSGTVVLSLETKAEVWVCVVDADGAQLVDGQVLPPEAAEGPFHSDSFTVSFGNGEVSMRVNDREANVPESASPLGYAIAAGGDLTPLGEGERPECL